VTLEYHQAKRGPHIVGPLGEVAALKEPGPSKSSVAWGQWWGVPIYVDECPCTEPEPPCCDYRDHGAGWCACPDHQATALHPYGWRNCDLDRP
jgi:hypothetical protein